MTSLTDDEDNEFPTRMTVVKGEYLTLDDTSRKTGGFVFTYYRPSVIVYRFTILVIGIDIQHQTMTIKISHNVCYFLPHSKHERVMEIIRNREDPDGLLE